MQKTFAKYKSVWQLAREGKIQEALQCIRENKPKEAVLNYTRIEQNFQRMAPRQRKRRFEETDFKIPDDVSSWRRKRRKVLLVNGPSGIGKTQMVLSLFKNPLLCRHMDKLKTFIPGVHDAIVFDDMAFAHYPREAKIHIVDTEEEADLNVKHGMITIPAETPRVITTNVGPEGVFGGDCYDKALLRRVKSVDCFDDLRLKK